MSPPFAHTSGPHDAKLVLLGEYWSETDERYGGRPFCGQSGRELFRMLADAWSAPEARAAVALRSDEDWLTAREAWLQREGILLTNVFALRPPRNDLGALCAAKGDLDANYDLPALRTENPRYVRMEHALPQLRRLARELAAAPRCLVLCLGGVALWALTGSAAIGTRRGATCEGRVLEADAAGGGQCSQRHLLAIGSDDLARERHHSAAGGPGDPQNAAGDLQLAVGSGPARSSETPGEGDEGADAGQYGHSRAGALKLLPTYHPAAVLRAWHWRPIVLADLLKGDRERRSRELVRPRRRVLVAPSIEEVESWTRKALEGDATCEPARLLAPDIETLNGQIRCIGFARSTDDVLVVPFIARLTGGSYWGDEGDELRAWACVKTLLESELPKVGQNFLFDLQYLTRVGIHCRNVAHDTMLLHHTLYPELQKGLGFLGSVYTGEAAWKLLRRKKGEEELKRDE